MGAHGRLPGDDLFPPGPTDAEIEAIVDEFTETLCGYGVPAYCD